MYLRRPARSGGLNARRWQYFEGLLFQAMTNVRWWIAGVIYVSMAMNYLDRQVLSVLAPEIRSEFRLTNSQYAHIVFGFQLAYMISSTAGGRLADVIGVRASYAFMMAFWSAASAVHGLATGFKSLLACRLLLGLGEGGSFPTAVKALSEWFPRKERATATGFINASLSLGGILAPPLTAFVALRFGWRIAFVVTGAVGFVWLAVWIPFYRKPAVHPQVGDAELVWIQADTVTERPSEATMRALDLLRFPQIWGLLVARFIADSPWQFYMFWFPEYLVRVRGMSLGEIGLVAWMPFLFGAIGGVAGGFTSDRMIRRGRSPVFARKSIMAVSAALLPAGILAVLAPSGTWAVIFVCVAALGHVSWVSNAQTLPADVLPPRVVGTIVGLSQTSGYLGNLGATLATGYLLDHFSYFPVFCAAGVMHPLATVVLLLTFRRLRRLAEHFTH